MFQDEQKAEDELAKKRAAFLLKQQKKAEEARVRKQQLEAESELKRDEARCVDFTQRQRRIEISIFQKMRQTIESRLCLCVFAAHRRKAEEERLRKEEEKTRRELIKQDYLRRKQQEMFEEQGLVKPKTPKPKQKHRPKSVFREESSDNFSKGSSTREAQGRSGRLTVECSGLVLVFIPAAVITCSTVKTMGNDISQTSFIHNKELKQSRKHFISG